MKQVAMGLLLLALAVTPATADTFTYHGDVGRVTEYRLTLTATGQQVCLGVRRPVRVQAEYLLREEVLSVESDGSLHLQVSGKVVTLKDRTQAFAGPRPDLPVLHVHVSPRGEELAVTPVTARGTPDLLARAAAQLARPRLVVLPEGEIGLGATWEWAKDGATQTNRWTGPLTGDPPRVRITTRGSAPIAMNDGSEALGLTVETTGKATDAGTLDFAPDLGLPLRHKGNAVLQTKTQVGLESPEGVRTFVLDLNLTVSFDLTLLRVSSPESGDSS